MTPKWYKVYIKSVAKDSSFNIDIETIITRLRIALSDHLRILDVSWYSLGKATNTSYDDWRDVYCNGWNDKMRNIVLDLIQSVEPVIFNESDWL